MTAAGERAVAAWETAGHWAADDLRREVFFFDGGDARLYGSLYSAAVPTSAVGVVVCGAWGIEADRTDPLAHGLALSAARLGGAGLVFHAPGFGDSYGDLAAVTLDGLARAAARAVEEAARRSAQTQWLLAGCTFGAAVACLAAPMAGARGLILMQPELRPSAYFERLARRARRATLGDPEAGMTFGYPIPERIVAEAERGDAVVAEALRTFAGEGVAIRYEEPADPAPSLPTRFERIVLPGRWSFAARDQPGMAVAAGKWLEHRTAGTERAR